MSPLVKGTYVLDLDVERRGFVCGNGDEFGHPWLDHTWLLLDGSGVEPDEGSWWTRVASVEVIDG